MIWKESGSVMYEMGNAIIQIIFALLMELMKKDGSYGGDLME